jgi:hypothetical protein
MIKGLVSYVLTSLLSHMMARAVKMTFAQHDEGAVTWKMTIDPHDKGS